MSDKPITERQAELNARRDEDVAAHQAAVEAQAVEAEPFVDAGYDETLATSGRGGCWHSRACAVAELVWQCNVVCTDTQRCCATSAC